MGGLKTRIIEAEKTPVQLSNACEIRYSAEGSCAPHKSTQRALSWWNYSRKHPTHPMTHLKYDRAFLAPRNGLRGGPLRASPTEGEEVNSA
jgi:hypothetical protein